MACAVVALSLACSQTRETTPEEQQLARMNRELASLQQSVAALQKRMDKLDNQAIGPSSAPGEGTGKSDVPQGLRQNPFQPRPAGDPAGASLDGSGNGLEVDAATLVVVVTADNYIVANKPTSDRDLRAALRAYADGRASPAVLLRAGSGVAHGRLTAAIDAAKAAGISKFSVAIDESRSSKAGAGLPTRAPRPPEKPGS